MRAYVTGASGFIGSHVVRVLRDDGWEVGEEFVELGDRDGLRAAMDGCDAVFHLAALYAFRGDRAEFERVNVQGTQNVLDAARAAGVARIVHTSTCATCGPVPGRPATEDDLPPAWELAVPYKATKLAAEQLALAAAGDGLDVVVVNPTTPVGEGDWLPTPTGRMVRGVATGRFRAYLGGTGVNLVDVRDVARGHLLAWEHGRHGEKYLLGGEDLLLGDAFALIARAAGRRPPRLRVPYGAARVAAAAGLLNRHEIALARLPCGSPRTRRGPRSTTGLARSHRQSTVRSQTSSVVAHRPGRDTSHRWARLSFGRCARTPAVRVVETTSWGVRPPPPG